MDELPADATQESHRRLALASELVESCPQELGQEIAVTGSVARGRADQHSDLELNLWATTIPDRDEWAAWLSGQGATHIQAHLGEIDGTGFAWTVCSFRDTWVEFGWCARDGFQSFVSELASGAFVGHERLQMGWTLQQGIILRTEGALATWRAQIAEYPVGLAQRVIANQTEVWSDPHVPGVRWGLADRGERMGLALRFVWDMQNLLRVLFALNREWDHDLKWTDERSLDLRVSPDNLSSRIDAMFRLDDLRASVETNQTLIVETLELARDEGFEVSEALHSIREGLREGRARSREQE